MGVSPKSRFAEVAAMLVDYQLVLSMVIGGCCSNVWTYEELLKLNSHIGSALTFSQMIFVTLMRLPSFVDFSRLRLRPRQVPLKEWLIQVVLFASGALMNNWAYAYNVPLPLMIIFRSAGLAVSMLLGWLLLRRTYSVGQVACVALVTSGVLLASLSRPTPSKSSSTNSTSSDLADPLKYAMGIAMLIISSLLTGVLGVLQEKTYLRYGHSCWKEGVFYNHLLSIPIFFFLREDVKRGLASISSPLSSPKNTSTFAGKSAAHAYTALGANLLTQVVCVSGVNRLSSQTTAVTLNLVLTARKALSLCLSIWWYQAGWNGGVACGAAMVFIGSGAFGIIGSGAQKGDKKTKSGDRSDDARTNGSVSRGKTGELKRVRKRNGKAVKQS